MRGKALRRDSEIRLFGTGGQEWLLEHPDETRTEQPFLCETTMQTVAAHEPHRQ